MSTREGPLLTIHELTQTFGRHTALDQLNLSIPAGTIFGLLGPNGAGKTTLLKLLTGQELPTSGRITWNDQPLQADLTAWKRRLGWAPENPEVFPYLTFRQNLETIGQFWGLSLADTAERAQNLLDYFDLNRAAETLADHGSLGMRKKLSLMLALLPDPEVLLLDEPFNGLDAAGCAQVRQLLRHLAGRGKTILLTSHLLDGLEHCLGGLAILRRGQLVFCQDRGWSEPPEGLEAFYFSHLDLPTPAPEALSWLS